MELKDTIEMMTSKDYKERFKAEVRQNSIRMHKLIRLICDYEDGKLNFTPICPIEILRKQADYMMKLHLIYIERAELEGIDLWEEKNEN